LTHFVFVTERTNNPIQGQAVDCARRSVGLPSGQLFFYIECDYRNTPKTTPSEITIPVKSNKNKSSGESSEESSKEESLESIESNSEESSEETIDVGAEIAKIDLSLLKRDST